MDIDQLTAFDRVVREGSFSRAALALGIGQPAVSARMAALESAVGGALFTRGRRIALTALGESFLPYARRALEVLAGGLEAARLARGHRVTRDELGRLARPLLRLRWWQSHHPELTRLAERSAAAIDVP